MEIYSQRKLLEHPQAFEDRGEPTCRERVSALVDGAAPELNFSRTIRCWRRMINELKALNTAMFLWAKDQPFGVD